MLHLFPPAFVVDAYILKDAYILLLIKQTEYRGAVKLQSMVLGGKQTH